MERPIRFEYNRFVSAVDYRFDDGSTVTQRFDRVPSLQMQDVTTIVTSSVVITIRSTERGPLADDDTIISEAAFEGSQ